MSVKGVEGALSEAVGAPGKTHIRPLTCRPGLRASTHAYHTDGGDCASQIWIALAVVAAAAVVAAPITAITNGQPDGGQHPYLGLIVFDSPSSGQPAWRCTGSMLSSTLVLTAGHCTDGAAAARIWFAEDLEGNSKYPYGGVTSHEGTPYTYPGFCAGCGMGLLGLLRGDVGVVVLSEPIPVEFVAR